MTPKKLDPRTFAALAAKFSALGEINRLRIVHALHDAERSVGELVNETGLSQPNVSRHLKVLAHAGLITNRRDGVTSYYRLVDKTMIRVCDLVCGSLSERLC